MSKECLQLVAKLQKPHVVFVSPLAMQLCGIVIAGRRRGGVTTACCRSGPMREAKLELIRLALVGAEGQSFQRGYGNKGNFIDF